MQPVFAIASNITTSLGSTTREVWEAVAKGRTGIKLHEAPALSPIPFWASRLNGEQWKAIYRRTHQHGQLTAFERLALASVQDALDQLPAPLNSDRIVFILASTKGNIHELGRHPEERDLLSTSARLIAKAAGIPALPVVVSHACVSGVTALLYGMRLLQQGRYEQAIVTGADQFTRFVLSGFQSFQAVADGPCRPFDAARNGINLGEAASTIILSMDSGVPSLARLCGGSTSNDANHISGPSRTGAELAMAIGRALQEAGITPQAVQAISAHGTATVYNDEMEAKAFAHAGLLHAQVHSMKGYVGHTLGAAGVLESAMILQSLQAQQSIASAGYSTIGVSEPVLVTQQGAPTALD